MQVWNALIQDTRLLKSISNRGSVFLGVLILGSVLSIAAGAVLILASLTANKVDSTWKDHAAFYAADGGLNRGLAWVRYNGLPASNRLFILSSNGFIDSLRIFTNGWVVSHVAVDPSVDRPLTWSYSAKCSVVVVVPTPPAVLDRYKCERISIPMVLP